MREKFTFEMFVAFRHLISGRKAIVLHVISIISLFGIIIGVTAMIFVLSVMNGLRIDLREKILGLSSHAVMEKPESGIADYDLLAGEISAKEGVKMAFPYVRQEALLASFTGASGAVIKGVRADDLRRAGSLAEYMRDGEITAIETPPPGKNFDPDDPVIYPGVILGRELALNLGAWFGETVNLISPTGELTPAGFVPKMEKFQVVGVFKSGMYQQDATLAFIDIDEARKFFELGSTVDGVEIIYDDFNDAEQLSEMMAQQYGDQYKVTSWEESNRNLFAAMKLEKLAMSVILILMVLVASFNIVANLMMMVVEKKREIAILKSLGATDAAIRLIFQFEGLIVGVVGSAIGAIAGVGITLLTDKYHLVPVPASIYMENLPIRLIWGDVAMIVGASIAIAFLATVYPASKAASLDPVRSLRYE